MVGMFVLVLIAFTVLVVRLLYLQVIEGKEFRRLSEINSIRLQDIDAPRGLILDNSNNILVDNRPSFDLYIVLRDAKPVDKTLAKVAALIGEPVDQLEARLKGAKKQGAYAPLLVKADIGRDMLAGIEVHKFELPGVVVHVVPRRHYIFEQHAAHLLGYMGEINPDELLGTPYADCKSGDSIGKFGMEKAYEGVLRGKRGGRQVEVNANGQVVRVLNTVDAQPGQNIVMTIDHAVQERAEELLQGRVGAAVAIDPSSGRVLAMASNPSFDPNMFVVGLTRDQWSGLVSNPFRPLENKAIQAEYPPASTYKIVTALAGLEEGVIDAHTTYYCPGYYRFGNRAYRCWRKSGHGEVQFHKALSQSCDVYFYQVGEALGVDRLAKYANALGLGYTTGINLDRESRGLIPTAEWKLRRFGVAWQKGETLSIAIGQGFNLATPLQMAVLAATIGNGGTRYKPYMVQEIKSIDDQISFTATPEVAAQLKLKSNSVPLIHQALWEVVNHERGTAYLSRIKDLAFAGKTGTAQVVGRPSDGEGKNEEALPKDHAWFVCYAPSENPKIAVAVIIEHGEHGSSAAAPVAREMVRVYLNLPPDNVTEKIE
ncbi:MAG: penicillin-binding protein 2, partial [Desulfatitalea sp.]|nr:penicillin-binding protein 2 [Desulfatitalea sp.]